MADERLRDGVFLKALVAIPEFDPVRTWGPGPLLLLKAPALEGSAPFQFADEAHTTNLASTASTEPKVMTSFLAPGSVVVPIRKSDRNPWTHIALGRAATNDIRLNDKGVSKIHCYFFPPPAREGEWRLQDAKSTNGTWVLLGSGRQKVPSKDGGFVLRPGTELQLGTVLALFVSADDLRLALDMAKRYWPQDEDPA